MAMHTNGRTTRILPAALIILPLLAMACASSQPPTATADAEFSGAAVLDREIRNWEELADTRAISPPSYRIDEVVPWIESRAFIQANIVRERCGLERLEIRLDLMDVARVHAVDMARRGYFAHYSPEGMGPGERARSHGIPFFAYAENLARVRYSEDPAGLAVIGWIESPGHRRNLLDEGRVGYRYTGIGVAQGEDGAVYLAQVFLR